MLKQPFCNPPQLAYFLGEASTSVKRPKEVLILLKIAEINKQNQQNHVR